MGRGLNDLLPQSNSRELDNPDYLKVFVPGSRRDSMNLFWLNTYILRYIKLGVAKIESGPAENKSDRRDPS